MLEVASVETADSGDYICSAIATDSSDSQYVLSSDPASATATLTVSKSHSETITTAPYTTVILDENKYKSGFVVYPLEIDITPYHYCFSQQCKIGQISCHCSWTGS